MSKMRGLFASRRLPWVIALIAIVLGLPTLSMGPILDDLFMRATVQGLVHHSGGPRGLWDLYRFADGEAGVREAIGQGVFPWWSSPDLKLAFFRPLSSAWIALDYTLLASAPWAGHVGSVLLYVGLALVVWRLYGDLLGGATAGLAALLYVIDDAHAMPLVWAANRHALVSAFFGFAALLAHVRRATVPAVLLLAASLAGGESAVAILPYFLGYALFAEEGGRMRALRRLAPLGAVLAAWAVLYVLLGYGVRGSAGYVHPSQIDRFLLALIERAPQLALAQLLGPPADLWAFAPAAARPFLIAAVGLIAIGLAWLLGRATRGHRLRGFFAFGALLSLPPLVGTFPSDRMLIIPGFGAFGLLAIAIGRVARARLDGVARRRSVWLAAAALFVHGPVALLLFFQREQSTADLFARSVTRGAESLPTDAAFSSQEVIVIVAPDALLTSYMFVERLAHRDLPSPPRGRVLAVVQRGAVTVERDSPASLVVRASEGGMFSDVLSSVYRDAPFVAGEHVRVADLDVTVLELDAGGQPASLRFEWERSLGDGRHRWLAWRDRAFAEVTLPQPGERLELRAVDWMAAYAP